MGAGKSALRELVEQLAIAVILAALIITFVVQSFVVDGPSMEPTLDDRERLFVNKFIYRFRDPQRGEIIIFTPRGAPGNKFIKRIIGLPGETIEIRGGTVFIDGEPLAEDYIKDPPRRNYGPYTVGEGEYFVLGDNRNNSSDSRFPHVGMVETGAISGKAFWVFWPVTEMRYLSQPDF